MHAIIAFLFSMILWKKSLASSFVLTLFFFIDIFVFGCKILHFFRYEINL